MYRCKLKKNYSSLKEFESYDEVYGLVKRLGFESAKEVWSANPTIEGSTDPGDYKVYNPMIKSFKEFKKHVAKREGTQVFFFCGRARFYRMCTVAGSLSVCSSMKECYELYKDDYEYYDQYLTDIS